MFFGWKSEFAYKLQCSYNAPRTTNYVWGAHRGREMVNRVLVGLVGFRWLHLGLWQWRMVD